jgi:hypothetical protein
MQELNNPYPSIGHEVELRLYSLLTLTATIISLFVVIPANFFQQLPLQINIATVLFGTLAAGSCQ